MTTYNFFVYCPDGGFQVFETLDEALDEANERVQGYLGDGWSEEVTGVCAGKITHRAKMCDQVFPDGEIDEDGLDEAGEPWGPDCDYKCNYKMFPENPAEFCEQISPNSTSPLYAHPQQAPEVSKLVEALERISNMDSMSYHSLESAKIVARNAITAYRKGGDL